MYPELGLTAASFFESLPDGSIRRFFDASVLSVLDALFAGCIAGRDLRRIAVALVDLHALLGEEHGRRLVLGLVPEAKRAELEIRVERSIDPEQARVWSDPEVTRLRDFFGLIEERLTPPLPPTTEPVTPSYGLFDHQRRAVQELLPLLEEGDRRAVLHLPTGVGKTRTAMHVVASFLSNNDPSVVVWLASGKELLEQAAIAFKEAWTHLGTRPGANRGRARPAPPRLRALHRRIPCRRSCQGMVIAVHDRRPLDNEGCPKHLPRGLR